MPLFPFFKIVSLSHSLLFYKIFQLILECFKPGYILSKLVLAEKGQQQAECKDRNNSGHKNRATGD